MIRRSVGWRQLPWSLVIVALLVFLDGCAGLVAMIVGLTKQRVVLNLNVLSVFAAFGILRLSAGWRTYALVYLWLSLVALPIEGVMLAA